MQAEGDIIPHKAYAFLSKVLDSPEIEFFFEWLGFCLIKGYPLQKFLLLQGPGGNGKSVLINFISAILGEKENVSNMTLDTLENEKFGRVHLYGKHLNAFADIDASFFKNSSFIKALTGDDYIYAEYKGRDEQLIVLIQIFNQAHIKAQLENPPQTAPNTSPK